MSNLNNTNTDPNTHSLMVLKGKTYALEDGDHRISLTVDNQNVIRINCHISDSEISAHMNHREQLLVHPQFKNLILNRFAKSVLPFNFGMADYGQVNPNLVLHIDEYVTELEGIRTPLVVSLAINVQASYAMSIANLLSVFDSLIQNYKSLNVARVLSEQLLEGERITQHNEIAVF